MENRLICADNLDALRNIEDESIDLIYIDPPFLSNRHYEVIWGAKQRYGALRTARKRE